jgi:116 kDa U5 small nuclear ribonucleoprotein component N-terminus
MDSDLYDEFGNYIGPDLESESEEEEYEAEIDVKFCFNFVSRGLDISASLTSAKLQSNKFYNSFSG